MKEKMLNFIKTTKGYVTKHSPEILTGIGVTSMITSTVLAVKATPRALILLEEAKTEKGDELTPIESVKAAWKPYIPAAIAAVTGAVCIIGASAVNSKRNAAIATAYALSEKTLLTYRDKVVETLGEKKEKEIREKIAQDEVDKKHISSEQVIVTSKGNTLCMESISGRLFRSDIDQIKKVINELNRNMKYQNYISLNELNRELGLQNIPNGDRLGWNIDDGYIEVHFGACIADNDEPCIVLDYSRPPKYDFDRFF